MKLFNNNNQIKSSIFVNLIIAMLLTGCAFAPWQPAIDKSTVSETKVIEAKDNSAKAPEQVVQRKNLLITSELASSKYMLEAEQARAQKKYAEALTLYDKVLSFLPDNPNAINGKIKVERELAQVKKN